MPDTVTGTVVTPICDVGEHSLPQQRTEWSLRSAQVWLVAGADLRDRVHQQRAPSVASSSASGRCRARRALRPPSSSTDGVASAARSRVHVPELTWTALATRATGTGTAVSAVTPVTGSSRPEFSPPAADGAVGEQRAAVPAPGADLRRGGDPGDRDRHRRDGRGPPIWPLPSSPSDPEPQHLTAAAREQRARVTAAGGDLNRGADAPHREWASGRQRSARHRCRPHRRCPRPSSRPRRSQAPHRYALRWCRPAAPLPRPVTSTGTDD